MGRTPFARCYLHGNLKEAGGHEVVLGKKGKGQGGKGHFPILLQEYCESLCEKKLIKRNGKEEVFSSIVRAYRDECLNVQSVQYFSSEENIDIYLDISIEHRNENLAKECVDTKEAGRYSLLFASQYEFSFFSPHHSPCPLSSGQTHSMGHLLQGGKKISRRPLTTFSVPLSKDLTSAGAEEKTVRRMHSSLMISGCSCVALLLLGEIHIGPRLPGFGFDMVLAY